MEFPTTWHTDTAIEALCINWCCSALFHLIPIHAKAGRPPFSCRITQHRHAHGEINEATDALLSIYVVAVVMIKLACTHGSLQWREEIFIPDWLKRIDHSYGGAASTIASMSGIRRHGGQRPHPAPWQEDAYLPSRHHHRVARQSTFNNIP